MTSEIIRPRWLRREISTAPNALNPAVMDKTRLSRIFCQSGTSGSLPDQTVMTPAAATTANSPRQIMASQDEVGSIRLMFGSSSPDVVRTVLSAVEDVAAFQLRKLIANGKYQKNFPGAGAEPAPVYFKTNYLKTLLASSQMVAPKSSTVVAPVKTP